MRPTALLLGHGLGDAGDLPVALPAVLFLGAGLVLLAAWMADRRSVSADAETEGRALPRLTSFADSAVTRGVGRALTLAGLITAIVTAAMGPSTAAQNPAPRLVFMVFWGLLIPASLLFGRIWRAVNPFRTLAAGLARLSGDPDWSTAAPLPKGIGVWPAVIQLGVFVWAVLGIWERSGPVLMVLLALTLVQLLAANRYGPAWFDHGDPFEVVADLAASVAPLARNGEGVLVLRAPRIGASHMRADAGVPAILALLVGGYLTDFTVDTPLVHELRGPYLRTGQLVIDTLVLAVLTVLVLLAIRWVTRRASFLLPAFVPVAAGYALAHDFGVLIVEGQFAVIQLSDPLGLGWDLLGLSGRYVPAEPIPAMVASLVVVGVLIVGHVAAALLGRSLVPAQFSGRAAVAVQLPLRAFLVVSVVVGMAARLIVA